MRMSNRALDASIYIFDKKYFEEISRNTLHCSYYRQNKNQHSDSPHNRPYRTHIKRIDLCQSHIHMKYLYKINKLSNLNKLSRDLSKERTEKYLSRYTKNCLYKSNIQYRPYHIENNSLILNRINYKYMRFHYRNIASMYLSSLDTECHQQKHKLSRENCRAYTFHQTIDNNIQFNNLNTQDHLYKLRF